MKITPDNFFLFIFIFWDVTEIIFGTTVESILGLPTNQANSMVSYIILLLLMVHIIVFQKFKEKELYAIMIISFPVIFSALKSSNYSLLSGWMFIIASQKSDFEKLIRTAYKILRLNKVYLLYGIPVFGQKVFISEAERELVGITYDLYLDNGYMALLIRYGILVYGIFSVCYLSAMIFLYRKKQWYLLIILFIYALYGVMENGNYRITHNIFLFSFGSILYGKAFRKRTWLPFGELQVKGRKR